MKTLSVKNAKSLIGKTINWKSFNSNGTSVIIEFNVKNENPFVTVTKKGDNLDFSFLDLTNSGKLLSNFICYGDSDRAITFNII